MPTKQENDQGFVLFFSLILTTIILAIAFGVAMVSVKEGIFGTSAKDSNEAFFAADAGIECALFYDKPANNSFPLSGPATSITCGSEDITPTFSSGSNVASYDFVVKNFGSSGQACAKVKVFKDNTSPPMNTVITAEGYNVGDASCNSSDTRRVERKLQTSYLAAPESAP